jgi:hypothetical protein
VYHSTLSWGLLPHLGNEKNTYVFRIFDGHSGAKVALIVENEVFVVNLYNWE